MSTAEKTLARMRANPRDWRLEDLEAVAARLGIQVRKPGGSHVVFRNDLSPLAVSVPARRPIKPVRPPTGTRVHKSVTAPNLTPVAA